MAQIGARGRRTWSTPATIVGMSLVALFAGVLSMISLEGLALAPFTVAAGVLTYRTLSRRDYGPMARTMLTALAAAAGAEIALLVWLVVNASGTGYVNWNLMGFLLVWAPIVHFAAAWILLAASGRDGSPLRS